MRNVGRDVLSSAKLENGLQGQLLRSARFCLLGIVLTLGGMRGKEDIQEWINALTELRNAPKGKPYIMTYGHWIDIHNRPTFRDMTYACGPVLFRGLFVIDAIFGLNYSLQLM